MFLNQDNCYQAIAVNALPRLRFVQLESSFFAKKNFAVIFRTFLKINSQAIL